MSGLRKEWAAWLRAILAYDPVLRSGVTGEARSVPFRAVLDAERSFVETVNVSTNAMVARWLAEAEDETDWRGLCERLAKECYIVHVAGEAPALRCSWCGVEHGHGEHVGSCPVGKAEAALAKAKEGR